MTGPPPTSDSSQNTITSTMITVKAIRTKPLIGSGMGRMLMRYHSRPADAADDDEVNQYRE
jgi:hypothetical protein